MQVGCDPKADSTKTLMKGEFIPTVLNVLRDKGDDVDLEDIVFEGYNGVLCVEAGEKTTEGQFNLVIRGEGLKAAKTLQKEHNMDYYYGRPYGLEGYNRF